ncbi:MAG: hypothetical protein WCA12_08655 [Burkholderiales bacterium]
MLGLMLVSLAKAAIVELAHPERAALRRVQYINSASDSKGARDSPTSLSCEAGLFDQAGAVPARVPDGPMLCRGPLASPRRHRGPDDHQVDPTRRLIPSDVAFCRTALGVRFSSFAIRATGCLPARDFSVLRSIAAHGFGGFRFLLAPDFERCIDIST